MAGRWIAIAFGVLVVSLAGIQLVPRVATNPPVGVQPEWNSPETEALARRACFDCHSNEVVLPWYGRVAPVSWVLRHHIDEGRVALNFSEMERVQPEAHESGEEILEGEMPPRYYTLMHPDARLSEAELARLAEGLDAMFK